MVDYLNPCIDWPTTTVQNAIEYNIINQQRNGHLGTNEGGNCPELDV